MATANPLTHAFSACALASMETRVMSNGFNFSGEALAAYTRALATTHVALRNPDQACDDTTLAAVLLLSLFEIITAKQSGMSAWGSHVQGAIELVRSRGRNQPKTRTDLSLFIAVRTQMIMHSATSDKPIAMGAEWWIRGAVGEVAAAACQRLSIQTAELRVAASQQLSMAVRTSETIARLRGIAQQAVTLDRACVAWGERLPTAWQPQTVAWEGDRRIDVYADMFIASVWNMMRCTRLSLAAVIVRCAAWDRAPADYRTTPEYAAATRTCSNIISDIIATVPFYLGWHLRHRDIVETHYRQQQQKRRMAGADEPHPPSFVCGVESEMKGLAGYFLAWPLANVNSQDYATDAQRVWAVGRLRYIAGDLGVRLESPPCSSSETDLGHNSAQPHPRQIDDVGQVKLLIKASGSSPSS
ncbi:negative acting factor-like protein [Grosmannia clavigera kw1407]|uniref:Negative acting factor-like protein n=1 Tax=Grosmannia clavigera (strain kw1407 / UAMH 11150) TaxID=655863 RepID=F0XNG0_GROCL|nr:negative acting factor-like protein [Grosmannia clavigera kw1407]EFX00811.1 negative acting factor-like protein [Grosmannia clavigera kw1407]